MYWMMKGPRLVPSYLLRMTRVSWELGFLPAWVSWELGFLPLESGTWLSSELGFLLERGEATGSLER